MLFRVAHSLLARRPVTPLSPEQAATNTSSFKRGDPIESAPLDMLVKELEKRVRSTG